jgi:ankyrin repeat protein
MLHQISFHASVTGEDVLRVLGLVAGGNLRLVDMRHCRKLIASAIEEILHRLHATCPAVNEVDITGCSDQVVLRALSVRAVTTFGASASDVFAQLMMLAEGNARCPLPAFLNALQDREPRLVFDPAFAPVEGAFFTARSLGHAEAGVLVEACVAGNATAIVDAAVLLGVSFAFGNQGGTRIFDCNKRDSNGQGSLHVVSRLGCPGPLFAVLRSAGADVNAKDNPGNTPLAVACQAQNLKLASMLTDAGADVSVANEQGDMPLLMACKAGNLGLAKLLKDAGADVSVAACSSIFQHSTAGKQFIREGDTPLLMACKAGNFELADMLKDAGAKVSVANEQGDTPLLVASAAGNLRLATMLRDAGADVSVANKKCETPLLAALATGNLELATVLLSWGADAKAVRLDGQGVLHLVAERGCPGPLFAALRSAGADVNAKDKQGNTPLMMACQAGNFELATMLKDAGADVSVANEQGECPLLAVFATGNLECAKLLLGWGADAKAVRRDGAGVIALGIHSKLLDMINVALEHGPERIASQSTFDSHALAQAYFSPRNLRGWLLAGSSPRTLALEISALLTYPEVDAGIVKRLECVRYWLQRHEGLLQDTTKWLVPHVVEQLASQEPRAFFQGDEPVASREDRCRLIKCIELKEEVPSEQVQRAWRFSTPVHSVAFSPDGCKLAHTEGAEVVVGCAVSGIESCRLVGHSLSVNAVALNQDGKFVATCSDDKTVRMWSASKGTCEKVLSGHVDSVLGIAFAPGDKLLASCSADHSLRLWDVQSGAEIKKFAGHRNTVNGIVFSPDGALLASCSGALPLPG